MTDDMRAFINALPNAGELDPAKRAQNEREIARRVGGLSPSERTRFETELRELFKKQDERMTFRQKWAAANAADELKRQLSRNNVRKS